MQDRVKLLEEFYNQDPNDPFNGYALALEYLKEDKQRALALFEELLRNHPTYIATYYHAAKLYETLGRHEEAASTYEKGIAVTRSQNQLKALRELQSAYDEFRFE